MSDRASRNCKALSVLIVWALALGGFFAASLTLAPSASAGVCDQVGGVITGDWTITTAQECSGIVYTVDGSINVNSGGSLTLVNGGVVFAKDASHTSYSLNVNPGGSLILDNSFVTTERDAIAPYVKLAFTVTSAAGNPGSLVMRNGATLRFPGWFNATGVAGTPAVVNMTGSTITGFTDADLVDLGIDMDDNNDAPQIAWTATSATLYRSRIERIYEYVSIGNGTGTSVTTLAGGSNLYAYDSYIGVDFSDLTDRHNDLRVDGTSNAYLFNVTVDRTQDPASMSTWQPAYVPAAGGNVYLLRWMRATVLDSTAFPVSGATIWSSLSPSATTAQYPDNGFSATPSQRTLWYLGRTSSGATQWNRTNAAGMATIPLYTDRVDSATLPNAESFGNYRTVAAFSTSTVTGGVFFPAYPAIADADNSRSITLAFSDLQVRTGPDLELRQGDYAGTLMAIQNQPFTVSALIYNSGQTTATGVSIGAYLDGNPSAEQARVDGLSVITFLNQTLNVAGIGVTGSHTLMLVVDPDNTINEGGAAQENNNFVNITLEVQPPPSGFVAIASPTTDQTVEVGSQLSVTGYVRDPGLNGIVGVPLLIELRSSAGPVASNTTVSGGNGFFLGVIDVPTALADGTYTVVVAPTSGQITSDTRSVEVRQSGSILYQPVPFLRIPWWLFLVIVGAIAGIVVAATLYFKFYGLGKMVECGECGAFIPEDATACPKCGVEFEKDMAKCSNCQAWIPVDVKRCPECGVEFATGQMEMADYQEKMRLQYDEVVQKFKQEASRQLGRALSDREFQEWWRKQPTFVTFEDWLREEEEMRKMGSKPCPVCGTLNSVTATVCHKCGSLMKEIRPPGGGGGVVAGPPAPRMSPPGPSSSEDAGGQGPIYGAGGAAAGTETIPHRVIRRPSANQPVVQKKVVRKPVEGQSEGSDQSSDDQSRDDL